MVEAYPWGFIAETEEIILKASAIDVAKDAIYARLAIFTRIPYTRRIKTTKLNLLSERSINELARTLAELYPLGEDGKEWIVALHTFCDEIVERITTPAQPEQLCVLDDPTPRWVIKDFLLSEAPNIIFAPGGAGKSFLSLFIAICIENAIGFFGEEEQSRVLYLDWETDFQEMSRRATLIRRGLPFSENLRFPDYLRMYVTLEESLEHILESVTMNGYRVLIIDSAACAIGGDISNSEQVVRFFSGIRKINACGVTTLIISHVSKSDKKENKKSTPIGSVFFENFPRVAWELKSKYDEEEQRYLLGLFCRKSNVGKLNPIGLTMTFHPGAVIFDFCKPDQLEAVDERETIAECVISALRIRPMTAKEIAHEIGASVQVVWNALSALKKQGKVVNESRGKWALADSNATSIPF